MLIKKNQIRSGNGGGVPPRVHGVDPDGQRVSRRGIHLREYVCPVNIFVTSVVRKRSPAEGSRRERRRVPVEQRNGGGGADGERRVSGMNESVASLFAERIFGT